MKTDIRSMARSNSVSQLSQPQNHIFQTILSLPTVNPDQSRQSFGTMSQSDQQSLVTKQLSLARLNNKPQQIDKQARTLWTYFTGQEIPGASAPKAPADASIEKILQPSKIRNHRAYLGNLSMPVKNFKRFKQHIMNNYQKDPEGTRSTLYAARNNSRPTDFIFHNYRAAFTLSTPEGLTMLPQKNYVFVDDGVRGCSWDNKIVDPSPIVGHELDHASSDITVRTTLMMIPHPTKSNAEEARVVDGREALLRNNGHDDHGRFHAAHAVPISKETGRPAYKVMTDDGEKELTSGDVLEGRISKVTPNTLTLRTNDIGRSTMSLKDIYFASSGVPGSAAIFKTSPCPPIDIGREYISRAGKWYAGSWRGDHIRIAVTELGTLEINRTIGNAA